MSTTVNNTGSPWRIRKARAWLMCARGKALRCTGRRADRLPGRGRVFAAVVHPPATPLSGIGRERWRRCGARHPPDGFFENVPAGVTVPSGRPALVCVERVLAPLVELGLQAQALLVRFDRADRPHDPIDPRLRLELTAFARRGGAVPGVVIREPRLPPDPRADAFPEPQ